MKILNLSQEEMKAQQNGTSGEPLDAVGNRKDQRDEDLTKDLLFTQGPLHERRSFVRPCLQSSWHPGLEKKSVEWISPRLDNGSVDMKETVPDLRIHLNNGTLIPVEMQVRRVCQQDPAAGMPENLKCAQKAFEKHKKNRAGTGVLPGIFVPGIRVQNRSSRKPRRRRSLTAAQKPAGGTLWGRELRRKAHRKDPSRREDGALPQGLPVQSGIPE